MNTVLLEARPYRPFKSSEEYLYAMREDLAEWLNTLYPEMQINVENFMEKLDTGVSLCKVSHHIGSFFRVFSNFPSGVTLAVDFFCLKLNYKDFNVINCF